MDGVDLRPVGTNLKLVRRVRAKNLLSMKAKRAERLTGPGGRSRAPGRVQGQSPGGGAGGSAPRKLLGFSIYKRPRKPLLEIFFL